jgi:hypothetical protein
MNDMHSRVRSLLGVVAARCWQEPDLEDFLAWRGATLEYWMQMVFAATAGRQAWAATGETPLITACPAVTAKTKTKWADGAVIWPDGAGALVEIKAIPISRAAKTRDVVGDLAALLAVDWPATLEFPGPDAGVDERWWQARHDLRKPWALSIALLHGQTPLPDWQTWVPGHLRAGLAALRNRFPGDPPWVARTGEALAQPVFTDEWSAERQSAAIVAWASPPS